LTDLFLVTKDFLLGVNRIVKHNEFKYFDDEIKEFYREVVLNCLSLRDVFHSLLIKIFSYLTLEEVISKITLINHKMYCVAGDFELLKNYRQQELSKQYESIFRFKEHIAGTPRFDDTQIEDFEENTNN
jgi:hypothetical protein